MITLALLVSILVTDAPAATLRADACVPGTRVLLGDLVQDEMLLPAELRGLDLGRAPAPGYARSFERAEIESALDGSALALDGADRCVVRADTVTVGGAELQAAARAYVQGMGLPEGATLEDDAAPYDVSVARGRGGRELRPRLRDALRPGPLAVLVDVVVDGALQTVVPVAFRLKAFQRVAILSRGLSRGEELALDDVRFETMEIGPGQPRNESDPKSLVGRIAQRPLRAGDPLRAADFALPVLIRRNQSIRMVYTRGSLRAETLGIAREDGVLGSMIRVENPTTRKSVSGRVTGPGQVELNP